MQLPGHWMFLEQACGGVRRFRILSSRHGREVALVEDGGGRLRVFKVHGNLSAAKCEAFLRVRQRLRGQPQSLHLVPLLAFGIDGASAWEELAPADAVAQPGGGFDEYSPERAEGVRPGVGGESMGLAISVASAVLAALRHLASRGLSHGDVKPSNVLRVGGRWALGDFDTMCALGERQESSASTEGYVPPGGETGEARDGYALGKLLYELWTGNGRLEYPALPPWLVQRPWGRRERILNDTIHALCTPHGFKRLGIGRLGPILEALERGDSRELARAETTLRSWSRRGSRRAGLGMVMGALVMACAAAWAWRAHPVSREVRDGEPVALTWDGEPIAVRLFRTWDSVNDGQVRWTWDGIRKRLLIFNVHAALRRPLAVGEEVVVELKKDAWRGHVGLYLSDKPLPVESMGSFGHREAFGGVNHLLFFHVDGDAVVDPSGWEAGVPLVIPEGSWTRPSPRQGLEPYVVSMQVLDAGLRWQVSLGGEVIALGNMDRPRGRAAYLHVYAFDNTLCYLGTLTRKRRNAGSSP